MKKISSLMIAAVILLAACNNNKPKALKNIEREVEDVKPIALKYYRLDNDLRVIKGETRIKKKYLFFSPNLLLKKIFALKFQKLPMKNK